MCHIEHWSNICIGLLQSGAIDKLELQAALKMNGINASADDLQALIDKFDENS